MAEPVPEFSTLQQCGAAVLNGATGTIVPEADFAVRGLPLAERHRVVPLLVAGLVPECCSPFRRRLLALMQQTVRLEQELVEISKKLSAVGVEFLVLKGPALARQAYPVPEWRAYDDLDLWVNTDDLDSAVRALENAGYRRSIPLGARTAACARRAGIEVALVHPERGRLIEVAHGWRALAPDRCAAHEMLKGAVTLEVAGTSVRVATPIHALLMACAHGAHHRWDRFSWVVDVAGLWLRLSPGERDKACVVAHRWRVETMLGLGLRLAAESVGILFEDRAAVLADSPRVQELARRVGLKFIAHDSSRVPMLERLSFENDARDSIGQRLRALAGWIFTPTLGDIEAVPLPRVLYSLYAVLRPLRLLRHPWLRDWRKLAGRESGKFPQP